MLMWMRIMAGLAPPITFYVSPPRVEELKQAKTKAQAVRHEATKLEYAVWRILQKQKGNQDN